MNAPIFHISLYDLVFLGTIFIGLNFALQLWFTKKINQAANRFLSLALATMVLWLLGVLGKDIGFGAYFPHWSRLPLQFSLASGPLIYFYVLKTTRPEYKFRFRDLLHFRPLLLQQGALVLEVRESIRTGAATYDTLIFHQLNPVLQLLAFVSVIIYLYLAHRLIKRFYRRLKFNWGDRYRIEQRWLHRLLAGFGLLWLLWIPFKTVDYFYYHNQLGTHAYYPLYLLLAVTALWVAAAAFLRPEVGVLVAPAPSLKPPLPAEMKQMGAWLKKAMQTGRYYQDPELSLTSLAEKLELTTHELSRIINTVLKKSFNDFINEFRVAEAARKMQEPAYEHITLLGIAFESGFNSQSTFTRAFKHMTGKSPLEYKNDLKKDWSSYNLGSYQQFAPVILRRETTPMWSHEKLNRNIMFKNYIKTAFRSLSKNKGFTTLNVLGLALGLAICMLIVFYVLDEWSYDHFNTKIDRIYRVNTDIKFNGNESSDALACAPFASTLQNTFPEVERTVRFRQRGGFQVKKGTQIIQEDHVTYCDPSVFDVFTLPMIQGDPATALAEPNSIVITESIAKKYFNSTDVIGKTLLFNKSDNYKITGVIRDIPRQSHFRFDFFISMPTLDESREASWLSTNFQTYLVLKPGADPSRIENSFPQLIKTYLGTQLQSVMHLSLSDFQKSGNYVRYNLTPLKDIHLQSNRIGEMGENGNILYVYIFGAIAVFILLIACVNFMNLSTARSSNRAREVGVRKVLGSPRKYLVAQFLTESVMITFIATIISVIAAWALLPLFSQMSGKEIVVSAYLLRWLIPVLLILVLVIGCLAGAYPAFFLSGFQPIDVLKGKLASGFKGGLLRNFLVVFQFSISIFLIIGTLVIYNQLKYIQNKDLGYDRNHVLVVQNVGALGNRAKIFKQDIKQMPGVLNATLTSYIPTGGNRNSGSLFKSATLNASSGILSQQWQVDEDYLGTMGMKLIEGRNFSKQMATDSSGLIINESAARLLGFTKPLNKQLYHPDDDYGKK